jgi:exonuclease VII large subunit
MDNLKNEDTQKNVKMSFVETMKMKGLNFGDRSKSPKKTNQQKLIYCIQKEIDEMKDRTDLKLVTKGENERLELRFHNKPKEDNTVEFNIKYKSKIVRLSDDEVMSCENNVTVYVNHLTEIKNYLNSLNTEDKLFVGLV